MFNKSNFMFRYHQEEVPMFHVLEHDFKIQNRSLLPLNAFLFFRLAITFDLSFSQNWCGIRFRLKILTIWTFQRNLVCGDFAFAVSLASLLLYCTNRWSLYFGGYACSPFVRIRIRVRAAHKSDIGVRKLELLSTFNVDDGCSIWNILSSI